MWLGRTYDLWTHSSISAGVCEKRKRSAVELAHLQLVPWKCPPLPNVKGMLMSIAASRNILKCFVWFFCFVLMEMFLVINVFCFKIVKLPASSEFFSLHWRKKTLWLGHRSGADPGLDPCLCNEDSVWAGPRDSVSCNTGTTYFLSCRIIFPAVNVNNCAHLVQLEAFVVIAVVLLIIRISLL